MAVASRGPTRRSSCCTVRTVDYTDDFDKHLKHLDGNALTPRHVVGAAVYVRDTLEVAWLAAQSVFKDRATPELAIAIYARIDEERRRLAAEADEALKLNA